MKTSFAKTFECLPKNKPTEHKIKDAIFPDRQSAFTAVDDMSNNLLPEEVFVIKSYDETYKTSKIETLLLNKAL